MKSEKKILIAFILNLVFSAFEFIGGAITGSVAIVSDAVHDLGDAASIGISFFLERKSKKKPDENHTFGYARYSVIGGLITIIVLICGSVAVITNAIKRIISPTEINYDGMIIFAVAGVTVNLIATLVTRGGESVNRKAVNLHMLEDVLGWAVILVGAAVMRFTDFPVIDPIMSLGIAIFILTNAIFGLKEIFNIFLDKTPDGVSVSHIAECITEIDGVSGVHHIHIRSVDGTNSVATMHVVTDENSHIIKTKVRETLKQHGIAHVTIETETNDEHCDEEECNISYSSHHHHHHH